jgi:hypothetical protein
LHDDKLYIHPASSSQPRRLRTEVYPQLSRDTPPCSISD